MKNLLIFLFGSLYYCVAFGQNPSVDPTWSLVWSDEFTGSILDNTKWCRHDHRKFEHGQLQLAAYRTDNNDNLQFNNGTVTQIVKQETITVVNANANTGVIEPWTYEYSAPSMMLSQEKFKYGYFEIRCKLPDLPSLRTNNGIGPNFWLWWHNENTSLDVFGEIDIFEFITEKGKPHIQTFNAHYRGPTDIKNLDEDPASHFPGPDFSQFHTFACHWTPDFIKIFMDDREIHHSTFYPSQMIPQRIIVDMNLFLLTSSIDRSTLLPYEYEIDYVRVYKLKTGQCNTDYVSCSPDLLQNSVYKSVTLGNVCSYTQPIGTKRSIWASNNITIHGDYTVPVGADLTLDSSPCYTQEVHSCNVQDCIQCQ